MVFSNNEGKMKVVAPLPHSSTAAQKTRREEKTPTQLRHPRHAASSTAASRTLFRPDSRVTCVHTRASSRTSDLRLGAPRISPLGRTTSTKSSSISDSAELNSEET